jgi:hypothetical protein
VTMMLARCQARRTLAAAAARTTAGVSHNHNVNTWEELQCGSHSYSAVLSPCLLRSEPHTHKTGPNPNGVRNDEIGAANYMTPELVVKAASLIKTGKTYALGIPVDSKTPAYPPRTFKITIVQPGQAGIAGLGPSKTTYNDDIIDGWVGIGSQIDGFGHIGVEHVYYNGNKLADFADPTGLKKLGIEKVPPMVARGVLLDMAAYYNTDVVKEGTAFNVKEIEDVAKKQGVEIRQGDVLIFHTGWLSLIGKDDKRYSTGEPGVGVEDAKYLTSKGVVAVGADTWAVEANPLRVQERL